MVRGQLPAELMSVRSAVEVGWSHRSTSQLADELLSDTIGVRFQHRGAALCWPTADGWYIDKIGIHGRSFSKEHPQRIAAYIFSHFFLSR